MWTKALPKLINYFIHDDSIEDVNMDVKTMKVLQAMSTYFTKGHNKKDSYIIQLYEVLHFFVPVIIVIIIIIM